MHQGRGFGPRPVSAIAIDVPAIAVGTERMKFVVATEMECPARLVGRSGPTARVATEAAAFLGARVAETPRGVRTVQAREYLLEVLSQFQQLLGKLVQGWLGRRGTFNPRAIASTHLVLRFWPKSEPPPRFSRIA
jgi:hypothetical protein